MIGINPRVAAFLLALTPALAQYDPTASVSPSASQTTTIDAPLGTAYDGALDLDPQDLPPEVTPSPVEDGFMVAAANVDVQAVTINIFNSMSAPVSMFYVNDANGPPLNGNPAPGMLAPAQATQVVAPQGFIGQSTVNVQGADAAGSKWELSLVRDEVQGIHTPYIDISYVDGYSVPMTCSCNGEAVTGCNIELWNTGTTCESMGPGPVCYNPNRSQPHSFQGPPAPFFAPCRGAAYTFPADDQATRGCPGASVIDCCIGPTCPAPARQGAPPAKRSVMKNGARGEAI